MATMSLANYGKTALTADGGTLGTPESLTLTEIVAREIVADVMTVNTALEVAGSSVGGGGNDKVYFGGKVHDPLQVFGAWSNTENWDVFPPMSDQKVSTKAADGTTDVFDGFVFTAPRDGKYYIEASLNAYKDKVATGAGNDGVFQYDNNQFMPQDIRLRISHKPSGGAWTPHGKEAINAEFTYFVTRSFNLNIHFIMDLGAGDQVRPEHHCFIYHPDQDVWVGYDTGMYGYNVD
tara:strand:- start:13 stop:717 length:705 start_codon:yes stop_codon:yes gene_type:complete